MKRLLSIDIIVVDVVVVLSMSSSRWCNSKYTWTMTVLWPRVGGEIAAVVTVSNNNNQWLLWRAAVAFDRRATLTIGELSPRWPPTGQDSPPTVSAMPVVVATARNGNVCPRS